MTCFPPKFLSATASLCTGLGLLVFATATPAQSETEASLLNVQLVEDIGAAERVEAADRLRTLSQEIPAAACHLHSDIMPDESRKLLMDSRRDFEAIVDAVLNGNPEMNIIGGEPRKRTIVEIQMLDEMWAPTNAAIDTLLATPEDTDAIAVIKNDNALLFDKTSLLLSNLSAEYSNPAELLQVDALLLDIAGRQSMLTQKMSKEACEIWTGNRSDKAMAALSGSIETFDVSMNALLNGMPALGVIAAPTPEIKEGLEVVMSDWSELRAELEAVMAQPDTPTERKEMIYASLNTKMFKLEEIIHLYTIFSKHKY